MDTPLQQQAQPDPQAEAGRKGLLFVLLCTQAGIGLLEALIALFLHSLVPMALSLLFSVLLLGVAAGAVRGWRWARLAATGYEGLLLLGAAVRLLLRHGSPSGLTWLLVDLALPLAVIWLCWTLRVRRSAATPAPAQPERALTARSASLA